MKVWAVHFILNDEYEEWRLHSLHATKDLAEKKVLQLEEKEDLLRDTEIEEMDVQEGQ